MYIDIQNIPSGHSRRNIKVAEIADCPDMPEVRGAIECVCDIFRTSTELNVSVSFSGEFHLECSRCLNRFFTPLNGTFTVVIAKKGSVPQSEAEYVDFWYDDQTVSVDAGSALYDEIMIAVPMKPLCDQNCPGIEIGESSVPAGGKMSEDINEAVDPRWEKLRKLKK